MFINKDQMKARLNSPNNILNIIKPLASQLTPGQLNDPTQIHPPTTDNLPDESNRQRAARLARNEIDQNERHGEYTVNPNIDNDIFRSTIGILASTGATSQQIQKEFGLTRNQVVGAKKSKKLGLAERIERGRDKVSELALDKLMLTLGLMEEVDIVGAKLSEKANIAVAMSKVVASMSNSRSQIHAGMGVNLTVITPAPRNLSDFSIIDV